MLTGIIRSECEATISVSLRSRRRILLRLGQLSKLATLLTLVSVLVGCGTARVGSVTGGECKVFEPPQYQVLGRTRYDQRWADRQIEAGVAGCAWPRPKGRPPELERGRVKRPSVRKGFVARTIEVVRPSRPRAEPGLELPPTPAPRPPVQEEPPEPTVVRPAERSPLDRLLSR